MLIWDSSWNCNFKSRALLGGGGLIEQCPCLKSTFDVSLVDGPVSLVVDIMLVKSCSHNHIKFNELDGASKLRCSFISSINYHILTILLFFDKLFQNSPHPVQHNLPTRFSNPRIRIQHRNVESS